MKLTRANIARECVLSPNETDRIFLDDEVTGLGLRVRAGGSRKWILHYRWNGQQRRFTLGHASVLTIDEARHKAKKILVAVHEGVDPAAEKSTRQATASLTFSRVVDNYLLGREPNMRASSLSEYARHLRGHWKPLHQVAIGSIDRPMIAARLRELQIKSGPVAANRARSTLSAFFAWAMGEGLCDANPVIGTNRNEESHRERVLSTAELAAIWKGAPEDDYGRILRLLILTGQRRDEIGRLRWSEISLCPPLIALPGARTKNKRPHDVPLSAPALAVLNACARKGETVFGRGPNGYTAWSHAKRLFEPDVSQPWVIHDLRRSAATGMADLGVQPHVIEAVLNHVSGHKAGVAGIYNRSTYAAEKRAALELWAAHLIAAIEKDA